MKYKVFNKVLLDSKVYDYEGLWKVFDDFKIKLIQYNLLNGGNYEDEYRIVSEYKDETK
jgi:hypothetical protein